MFVIFFLPLGTLASSSFAELRPAAAATPTSRLPASLLSLPLPYRVVRFFFWVVPQAVSVGPGIPPVCFLPTAVLLTFVPKFDSKKKLPKSTIIAFNADSNATANQRNSAGNKSLETIFYLLSFSRLPPLKRPLLHAAQPQWEQQPATPSTGVSNPSNGP
ncbi:hypothetical protein EJ110_NYTH19577 [Nymphaea thermarum]|nr:hypothetical protein EJ110_NYTH19577 [Nymphaea thermarum]